MKGTVGLILICAAIGCSSSKPAPKPVKWESQQSPQQAQQPENAEANQPCSEQNLKNATEKQKQRCDPMRDMINNGRTPGNNPLSNQIASQTTVSTPTTDERRNREEHERATAVAPSAPGSRRELRS